MTSIPRRRERMTYREQWALDTARASNERFAARLQSQEYAPFLRAAVTYEVEDGERRMDRVRMLNQRIVELRDSA